MCGLIFGFSFPLSPYPLALYGYGCEWTPVQLRLCFWPLHHLHCPALSPSPSFPLLPPIPFRFPSSLLRLLSSFRIILSSFSCCRHCCCCCQFSFTRKIRGHQQQQQQRTRGAMAAASLSIAIVPSCSSASVVKAASCSASSSCSSSCSQV